MIPIFEECSIPEITYFYHCTVLKINHPVNIVLCKGIKKFDLIYAEYTEGKPSIEFIGCDTKWIFNLKEDRDSEYDRLIKKYGFKN